MHRARACGRGHPAPPHRGLLILFSRGVLRRPGMHTPLPPQEQNCMVVCFYSILCRLFLQCSQSPSFHQLSEILSSETREETGLCFFLFSTSVQRDFNPRSSSCQLDPDTVAGNFARLAPKTCPQGEWAVSAAADGACGPCLGALLQSVVASATDPQLLLLSSGSFEVRPLCLVSSSCDCHGF